MVVKCNRGCGKNAVLKVNLLYYYAVYVKIHGEILIHSNCSIHIPSFLMHELQNVAIFRIKEAYLILNLFIFSGPRQGMHYVKSASIMHLRLR